ncbi:MAG: DUF2807 domain-containing protein [Alphaproteobacteria bacterium]|nr:DUF2807 domain-containing protein [Alphaproteobacteria bacterium]MBV9902853.1 DUF2807 domain-containing protein [Alphaproteobacteria bacterium]
MIRTWLAPSCLLLLAVPAEAAERSYSVTDFDRVQVDGPFQVTLVTGRASGARASGSAAAIDRLSLEVQGRTLHVRVNRSAWGGYPGDDPGPVRIEATTQDLRAGTVIGSGSLAVDRARGLRIDLSVSGSGRVSVGKVEADNLSLALAGSGRLSIAGSARQLKANIAGSGDLDAPGLKADDAIVVADTAGTVSFAAARSADVRATGSGDVIVGGAPACKVQALGSGRVRCGG